MGRLAPGAPLDLAFMGTGNAFAPQRCWSGFVLDQRHLFDAPPTALYSLKQMGLDLAAIETVFISHFHADHFFGLPFLLLEYAYLTDRTSPLTIVGPPELEERLKQLVALGGYSGLWEKSHAIDVRYVEVEDGTTGTVNGVNFEAIEVDHAGPGLRCFGFRARREGRTLAYTGDTRYCEQLVQLAEGAEVLVSDCTYASGRGLPEHMSFEEVRELQARIAPTTQFVLTHLGGDLEADGIPQILVARDLGRYRF
jgi:ribonuclease BN (tRNA processing enzyme)